MVLHSGIQTQERLCLQCRIRTEHSSIRSLAIPSVAAPLEVVTKALQQDLFTHVAKSFSRFPSTGYNQILISFSSNQFCCNLHFPIFLTFEILLSVLVCSDPKLQYKEFWLLSLDASSFYNDCTKHNKVRVNLQGVLTQFLLIT